MIYRAIKDLAQYGIAKGLIEKEDETYVINSILQELQMDEYEEPAGVVARDTANAKALWRDFCPPRALSIPVGGNTVNTRYEHSAWLVARG